MSARLTVSLEPSISGAAASRLAAVLASLPSSLRPVPGGGELVAVSGSAAGWSQRALAALEGGARGILVIDPTLDDAAAGSATELRRRAAHLGVPVVLGSPWADNPAVPTAAPEFRRRGLPGRLLEARVTAPVGAALDSGLVAQLALVRAAVGTIVDASLVTSDDRGYTVLGALGSGLRVVLVGVRTNALPESARLRLLADESSVELAIPASATARPAHAVITDARGATLLPTVYENAHRASWRRLCRAVVETGSAAVDDLGGFLEDAETAAALFATRNT
jgi:hypothetical protein